MIPGWAAVIDLLVGMTGLALWCFATADLVERAPVLTMAWVPTMPIDEDSLVPRARGPPRRRRRCRRWRRGDKTVPVR